MIVIIGASASGKTEISKILENKYNYKKCITSTTREIRSNETNHIDYHFLTKEEFVKGLSNNEFVEHAIYNNNYYGINRKDINVDALVIVEPNGANTLIDKLGSSAYVVYIETDYEIRKQRMINRGDNIEDINNRLKNDETIFKRDNINRIDLIVHNNLHDLDSIALYIISNYKEFLEK